jgi:arylsulfatase
MKRNLSYNSLSLLIAAVALFNVAAPVCAQDKKPNIVFIMGDDIGMWNIGAYHRGLMAGRTPNLDAAMKEHEGQ